MRRKRKKSSGSFLLWLLVICVVCLGMYYSAHKTPTTQDTASSTGVVAALTEKVRTTVDKVLKKETAKEDKTANKEEKSEKAGSKETNVEKKGDVQAEKKTKPSSANTSSLAPGTKLSGKIAVVVDDCGYEQAAVEKLAALPVQMSFAVIPFRDNSRAALSTIKSNGKLAMLHLPMEPLNAAAASENRMIKTTMSAEEIQSFTREAIASLPGIKGVNNHQGSRATSDAPTIRAALQVIKSRGLFFVDSYTYQATQGETIARELGIRTGHNALFLDGNSDVNAIKGKIVTAAKRATQNGSIIVICHARPNTATAWSEIYQELKDAGLQFVPVTQLLY